MGEWLSAIKLERAACLIFLRKRDALEGGQGKNGGGADCNIYSTEHKAWILSKFLEADKQLQLMLFIRSEIQTGNCIIVRMGIYNNAVIQEYFCE